MRYVSLRRFVLDACDGPFGSAIKTEHYADEGARVIRLGNIGVGEWRDESEAFLAVDYWRQLVGHNARSGDVIVAGLGDEGNSVGRACVVPTRISRALVKADCYRLRIDPSRADPRFLAAFLSSKAGSGQAEALAEGSTRTRLTLSKALSIRVPEIDRATQSLVADYLDAETARIDALIAKKRCLIDLLAERRAGLIESEIRHLADQFGDARLKTAVSAITVGIVVTPSAWYVDDGVPALRGVNVRPGRIDLDDLVYLSDKGQHLHQKSIIRTGDVVVVRTGQAGGAASIPSSLDGANCIDLLIIRPGRLDPEYLVNVLNSDWTQKHIKKYSVGTIQSHFNVSTMTELPIPVPPSGVQQAVVARISRFAARIDSTLAGLERQVSLLREHRQALITAAVTGELQIPGRAAS